MLVIHCQPSLSVSPCSVGRLHHLAKYSRFKAMNDAHSPGTSSSAKIASTGQGSTHAPQSMHSSGSMKYWLVSVSVWMQSTGQTSTHEASFTPIQGCVIT